MRRHVDMMAGSWGLAGRLMALKVRTVAVNRLTKRFHRLDDVRGRFYRRLWHATAARVGAHATDVGSGFVRISRRGRVVFAMEGSVGLDNHVSLSLVADKTASLGLLDGLDGFRAAERVEVDAQALGPAEDLLARSGRVVVKPAANTGAGAGVTLGVSDASTLYRAAAHAALHCRRVLVEEDLLGHSYRLLFLDGELISAVRRDPPCVVGDGRSSLGRLIRRENESRLRAVAAISLNLLLVDGDCRQTLAEHGQTLSFVPSAGVAVPVKRVPNQNQARENHIVDEVHPSLRALGAGVTARTGVRLHGLDVLTTDIRRSLADTGGVINEVNGTPGLHHHYLVSRPEIAPDVAVPILEAALHSTSGRTSDD